MKLSWMQFVLKTVWLLLLASIFSSPCPAAEPDATIIQRVEDNLNGSTAVMELTYSRVHPFGSRFYPTRWQDAAQRSGKGWSQHHH